MINVFSLYRLLSIITYIIITLYTIAPYRVFAESDFNSYVNKNHNEEHNHSNENGSNKSVEGHSDHKETLFLKMSWNNAKSLGVRFSRAKPEQIQNTISLYGETQLNADAVVHVTPRFPGVIIKINKHLGEVVKKGDILAVIQSNESLAPYTIRAEVDGIIIEKDATKGEFVRDDNIMFVITNLDYIWVNTAVRPRDLVNIKVGSKAKIYSKSLGLTYRGNIDYIRPTLTEETRTALARIVIPNLNKKWFPGLFVTVEVMLDTETVPLGINSEAVMQIDGESKVFIKSKDQQGREGFEVRDVIVGRSDGKITEIVKGLNGTEEVAIGRTFILKAELGKGAAEHSH